MGNNSFLFQSFRLAPDDRNATNLAFDSISLFKIFRKLLMEKIFQNIIPAEIDFCLSPHLFNSKQIVNFTNYSN